MSEMAALADFLVRPPQREGKSLSSWCWRIYQNNGHDVPPSVRIAAKSSKSDEDARVDHLLTHLLGRSQLTSLRERERRLTEAWASKCMPSWYVRSATPRFCPLCMAEVGCHLFMWDLPLVSACVMHGCKLLEHCYLCGRKWSWATLTQGWQCSCGAAIAKAPLQGARPFAVRLSRILAAASDAHVPQAAMGPGSENAFSGFSYCTRDVYEVLCWLHKIRRGLTERRTYPLPGSWPVVPRRGARMEPGAWEVCAMAGLSSSIEVKARYALRLLLKGTTATLVELPRVMNWNSAKRLLDEIAGQNNPLARSIYKAIGGVLSEASAAIPSRADALFHPRLSTSERRVRIVELGDWWCRVAAHMPVLDPGSRLNQKTSARIALHLWSEPGPSAAVDLLNLLFDAAHQRLPMSAIRALVQRWHIPAELKKPKDVMLELANYFSSLHTGEVLFVQALVASALDHHHAEQGKSPHV